MLRRVAAVLTAALVPVATAAAEGPTDVAAVISGGVSLGAYQAGGTWAHLELLRHDRDRRLRVVTGASAGNVNAFLAALYWCDRDGPAGRSDRGVFANPFFDVWINLGWEKLSPKRMRGADYARLFEGDIGSATYRAVATELARDGLGAPWYAADTPFTGEDGLFTRSAFAAAEAYLTRRMVDARAYGEACELGLGVTVTRETAAEYPVETVSSVAAGRVGPPLRPEERLTVPTQRYVVPLQLVVDAAGGHLRNAVRPDGAAWWSDGRHDRIARALHLPAAGPSADLASEHMTGLIRASSAFPLVFAPVRLSVCLPREDAPDAAPSTACPPGSVPRTERFADGGFFDNVPLGLALELLADRREGPGTVEYVYVDPEQRRPPVEAPAPRDARALGLAWAVLGEALQEARTFELQGLARFATREIRCQGPTPCPDGERRFRASSRHHRIVGAYLVRDFAAFAHRTFRLHDYLVGVYDVVFEAAESRGRAWRQDDLELRRLILEFRAGLATLGLHGQPGPVGLQPPEELLWRLFCEEVTRRTPLGLPAAVCRAPKHLPEVCDPAGHWRADDSCVLAETCHDPVLAVHAALRDLDRGVKDLDDFGEFVRRYGRMLQRAGLRLPETAPRGRSSELVFDDPDTPETFARWTRDTNMRLLRRALAVEAGDEARARAAGVSLEAGDRELLGADVTSMGRFALRGLPLLQARPPEGVDLDPSTVDAQVLDDAPVSDRIGAAILHVFPWALGWDARRLGPVAGWEPRFDVFDARGTLRGQYTLTWSRRAEVPDLYHRLGAGFGLDAVIAPSVFVTAGHEQKGGPWDVGLSAGVDVLRSVRATVGFDRRLNEPYLLWTLLDVNGGLAWLLLSP